MSPADFEAIKKPGLDLALTTADKINIKKETLYIESLYENKISPIELGSSVQVTGDLTSTFEVGLHVLATAAAKQEWCCVVDTTRRVSPLALYEAVGTSKRFFYAHSFSPNRFLSVISHLVSAVRVVVAQVPVAIAPAQMARVMSRVREANSILIFMDCDGLCHASCDRRIVAATTGFEGLDRGAGVLTARHMEISEYEHGMLLAVNE